MKQKYYSMTPDISASGTTINDVGKQTYSHKHFNLWSFLLCLMAMMLPVGAWGGANRKWNKNRSLDREYRI